MSKRSRVFVGIAFFIVQPAWLLFLIFNKFLHKLVIGFHLGFEHAFKNGLFFTAMPKAKPWTISDGALIECAFTHWLVTGLAWIGSGALVIVMLNGVFGAGDQAKAQRDHLCTRDEVN